MSGLARRPLSRWQASPWMRSVLALVLLCAQLFVAAHSLTHVGEGLAGGRSGELIFATFDDGDDGAGRLPAAERHERCLVCLAAADLAAILPPTTASQPVTVLPSAQLVEPASISVPWRALCPPCRGPPVSV